MTQILLMMLLCVALVACAAHSPVLYGGQVARVTVDGSRFVVSFTDDRAEATRVSAERAPDRLQTLSKSLRAIELASGCDVVPGTLYGDWSLAEAWLTCPGKPQPRVQSRQTARPALSPPR